MEQSASSVAVGRVAAGMDDDQQSRLGAKHERDD
jgi:hypothetical protein